MALPIPKGQVVLVALINNRRDLDLLLRERWYRIPAVRAPMRPFTWLAFYQTAALGPEGKAIRYYARVSSHEQRLRRELLPAERDHPRAGESYVRLCLGPIRELPRAIRNITGMRLTFGFTSLGRLERFRWLHTLFGIRPLETIFEGMLRCSGIPARREYPIFARGRVRYRLDFAVFCQRGAVAIECDQPAFHSGRRKAYDRVRDRFLRRRGWTVLRLSEGEILREPEQCIALLRQTIASLGGVVRPAPPTPTRA